MPREKTPTLVLQAFARELQRRRLEKNWSQSELARQTWGKEGASEKRDVISGYEKGRNRPGPENLAALARALGCKPNDLLRRPPSWVDAMGDAPVLQELKDGLAHLFVNQVVPLQVGLEIMKMLKKKKRK